MNSWVGLAARWDEVVRLPTVENKISASPDRQVGTTRRQFVRGAAALATTPTATTPCNGAITDPIIALIAEEKRWGLLAVEARARAEQVLFALPKDERPEEFDHHPIMAEALSLEMRADQVHARIIETPARTLAGIFVKLEWAEGDADVIETVIADLRRWLIERQ